MKKKTSSIQKSKSSFQKLEKQQKKEQSLFTKPLNQFVTEESSQDEELGKTQTEERVMYVSPPFRQIVCGNHFFEPVNPKQYTFKCKLCDFHFQARIPVHKYNPNTGKIIVRHTGREI